MHLYKKKAESQVFLREFFGTPLFEGVYQNVRTTSNISDGVFCEINELKTFNYFFKKVP